MKVVFVASSLETRVLEDEIVQPIEAWTGTTSELLSDAPGQWAQPPPALTQHTSPTVHHLVDIEFAR